MVNSSMVLVNFIYVIAPNPKSILNGINNRVITPSAMLTIPIIPERYAKNFITPPHLNCIHIS